MTKQLENIELYIREDQYAVYHEHDPDIPTVRIKLPSLEEFYGLPWEEAIKRVDGYGLHPLDQHFENYRKLGYYTLPDKLKNIENIIRSKSGKKVDIYPHDIWDEIEGDSIGYSEEIKFIEQQQARRRHGHWIFIKGKPTYIDGYHYVYLTCWPIKNKHRKDGLAFYRDVDRRIFLYFKWVYTTKSAYFKHVLLYRTADGAIKKRYFNTRKVAESWGRTNGQPFIIEDFDDVIEQEERTYFGVAFPKRRRIGGTSQSVCFLSQITIDRAFGIFAIQALTERTAVNDVYKRKFRYSFDNMWFFFKPTHGRNNESKFAFIPDKATSLSKDTPPHGGVVEARSSENKAFDGIEITGYLNDESGKKVKGNVLDEWADTIKNTLAYGESIHGFAVYVSTLGEFEKGGGKIFVDLCRLSFPNELDDNGHTQTGLATLFISADDGYDNCIDMYGYSVMEDPDEPYINLEGKLQHRGSLSIILNKRTQLEKNKNWKLLSHEKRSNPLTFREASSKTITGENWDNTDKIREQIANIKFSPAPLVRRVSLEWSDGLSLTQRPYHPSLKVIMKEDDNGKFEISLSPPEGMRNMVQKVGDIYGPTPTTSSRFILGVDPFKYSEKDLSTNTKNPSKGAAVLKYKHDPVIDPLEKPVEQWTTNRYILTYMERPEIDVFCEDMAKIAIFWGALVNTENNVDIVIDRFRQWKLDGYLMHLVEPATGKISQKPGVYSSQPTHNKGFSLIQRHLSHHIGREVHARQLEQILDTENFDDITKNDLMAATIMCEIGDDNPIVRILEEASQTRDLSDFVRYKA